MADIKSAFWHAPLDDASSLLTLTEKGVKLDPQKQDSIQAKPAPTSKEELRRLLGVVTYLS